MSRAGRKRLHQLKRKGIAIVSTAETVPTPNQVARRMPHRRLVTADHAHDERMETPLGAQYVVGAIPRHLYVAGLRFRAIVGRYRAVTEAPRLAPSLAGRGVKSDGHDEAPPTDRLADEPKDPKQEYDDRMADYVGAMKALRTLKGAAANITHRVIVEEAGIPPGGFRALLEGLGALAEHFKQQQRAP